MDSISRYTVRKEVKTTLEGEIFPVRITKLISDMLLRTPQLCAWHVMHLNMFHVKGLCILDDALQKYIQK